MEKEIIICSAVKADDGTIYRGHRHGDCIMTIARAGKKMMRGESEDTQGFITSKNRYVGRKEARKIQEEAGIKSVAEGGYRYDTLFSEDLY